VTTPLFSGIYAGCKVLLTGHTGFKGSWLALWLQHLGAEVSGLSLDPVSDLNHWDLLELGMDDYRQDIRDVDAVKRIVAAIKPKIVFHLAAQPLVRKSYQDPLTTWSTNVQGTATILEACRQVGSVKAVVIVTSDKCYEPVDKKYRFREGDRLGGHDPYSASKAAAELVVDSFRHSFYCHADGALLASARAGNVIGGGDWSEDRLIPDMVRAVGSAQSLQVRSPQAIRPWQHVLDALAGYLLLGQKLLADEQCFATAWNFGPDADSDVAVVDLLQTMKQAWPAISWQVSNHDEPNETESLRLDSTKAREQMHWEPVWSLQTCLKASADWYQAYLNGQLISEPQLRQFIADATRQQSCWVGRK